MTAYDIVADYLIVGAGAMGLAFADVLLSESDATIAIVDRLDKPGGHWNHAYPFVRLHQPSAYYGVNSRPMGENRLDLSGRNKGMMELAGVSEILAYFDTVMRRDFLPTGRVQYFPQCEYDGAGGVVSNATGERFRVRARKTVDATYMKVQVPFATPPNFTVADGVDLVPPNGLSALPTGVSDFVIIGGGKTSMDAILYLLDLGVAVERITWIKPRDSWLIDRAQMQPEGFAERSIVDFLMDQVFAVANSRSVADMMARLEDCGAICRLDADIAPSMWRCATVSQAEMADLKRIKNVVRLGRVKHIAPGRIAFDDAAIECSKRALFVNCTADGLERRPKRPIFAGDTITLQTVRPCQQLFAAAMIGHVECAYPDDARKNALLPPAQHPDRTEDFASFLYGYLSGHLAWIAEPELLDWLVAARLDAVITPGFVAALQSEQGPALMETAHIAMRKITAYQDEIDAAGAA